MLRQRPVWPPLHRAICLRTDVTSIGPSFEPQYKLRNPEFTITSRVLITIQSPSIYASSPPIWILLQFGRDAVSDKAEIRLLIRKQSTTLSLTRVVSNCLQAIPDYHSIKSRANFGPLIYPCASTTCLSFTDGSYSRG